MRPPTPPVNRPSGRQFIAFDEAHCRSSSHLRLENRRRPHDALTNPHLSPANGLLIDIPATWPR
jgi:hypothetical protein